MEVSNIYRVKIAFPDESSHNYKPFVKDSTPIVRLARTLLTANLHGVVVGLTEEPGNTVLVGDPSWDDDQLTNPQLDVEVGSDLSMISVGGIISTWLAYVDKEGFDSNGYAMRIETETKFTGLNIVELQPELQNRPL